MKSYLAVALAICFGASGYAQTAADALRYAYFQPSGTARFVGAGGAFGALGADFGALNQNPGGLALFRTNEVALTPSLKFAHTDATLAGNGNPTVEDDKSDFKFDNIGIVFHTTPRSKVWKTFNVGIGFNRQANYNQAIFYEGPANGTILNEFFNEAAPVLGSGGSEDELYPFGARLAYDANAIYFQNDSVSYDFINNPNVPVRRTHALSTFGSTNEMVISMAGNYDEKLMVGFTVGVPFVNYRLEGEYTEEDADETVPYFDRLAYTEYLKTEGVGVNFKLGVIYRVNSMFRLGGAFHTPTLMGLTDTYYNTFSYDYTDANGSVPGDLQRSPDGTTDYRLRTPWRASANAAVIFRKYGFFSADVEWVDYGGSRYNFTADVPSAQNEQDERAVNSQIQTAYQQAVNVRLGGELALDDFRLRAGVNLLGKPAAGDTGFRTAYTAGAGVRSKSFFLDLGYRLTLGEGSVSAPYGGAPVAALDTRFSEVLLTVGFKF